MPGATFFGADNYGAGCMAGEGSCRLGERELGWPGGCHSGARTAAVRSHPRRPHAGPGRGCCWATWMCEVPEDMIFYLDSKNTQDEAFRVVGDTLPKIPNAAACGRRQHQRGHSIGRRSPPLRPPVATKISSSSPRALTPRVRTRWSKRAAATSAPPAYFPERYGEWLIPAMIDALECRPLPPAIYVDHVFINADNMCEYYPEHSSCS